MDEFPEPHMEQPLKPCPFCGNTDICVDENSIGARIICDKCGHGTIAKNNTKSYSIKLWNTRLQEHK